MRRSVVLLGLLACSSPVVVTAPPPAEAPAPSKPTAAPAKAVVPTDPAFGLAPPATVAVGDGFACAIRADRQVACWGDNRHGQLGLGDRAAREGVVVVPALADVVEVAAGAEHACARTAQGEVWCWGAGEEYRLGRKLDEGPHRPQRVPEVTGAVGVDAASRHSCALLAGGGLRCWGDPAGGRLGLDHLDHVTEPSNVALAAEGATGLVLGEDTTCVRDGYGRVSCWGIGDDHHANERHEVAEVSEVVGLANAGFLACALTKRGATKCWGHEGPAKPAETVPEGATQLALGSFGCGLVGGRVVCWDVSGLTNVYAVAAEEPSEDGLVTYAGLAGAKEIRGRHDNVCVRTATDEVFCWGDNEHGQLGRGPGGVHPTPVAVPFAGAAANVVAGSERTCVIGTDKKLRCWGDGLASGSSKKEHTEIGNVTAVAVGEDHGCAVHGGGKVACWQRRGAHGEIGAGPAPPRPAPKDSSPGGLAMLSALGAIGPLYVTAVSGLSPARAVAVANHMSCALTAQGVSCWGEDGSRAQAANVFSGGPCGLFGGDPAACEAQRKPRLVPNTRGAKALVGTSWGFCALTAQREVACWRHEEPTLIQAIYTGGAVSLHRGHDKICAIDEAGELFCVHSLGSGYDAGPFDEPVTDWSGGQGFECAVTKDGKVVCVGLGERGQLGDGLRATADAAVSVKGISGAKRVTAGKAHACALLTDASVVCWGEGDARMGKPQDVLPGSSQPVRVAVDG